MHWPVTLPAGKGAFGVSRVRWPGSNPAAEVLIADLHVEPFLVGWRSRQPEVRV